MEQVWTWFWIPILASGSLGVYLDECDHALGMEDGSIPDSSIRASSSYDKASVGPQNARIRIEKMGGAWCPQPPILDGIYEYLEIDLNRIHVITSIETQGRYGNGMGMEFMEQYVLEYWRRGLQDWRTYVDLHGNKYMEGNTDTDSVVKTTLNPPVIADKIRIVPYSKYQRTVCTRVEVRGCNYTDGVVSYSTPYEKFTQNPAIFRDATYDGIRENGLNIHGLGQLVDGKVNMSEDEKNFGSSYPWIGWKRHNSSSPPLEVVFEFDQTRNFSFAHFFMSNKFSDNIEVFSRAKIYFSPDGAHFDEDVVEMDYVQDHYLQYPRNVSVHMKYRVGKFVKFQLFFANDWIMISEVYFESEVVDPLVVGSRKVESEQYSVNNITGVTVRPISIIVELTSGPPIQVFTEMGDYGDDRQTAEPVLTLKPKSQPYVGVIIGTLTAVIMILAAAIFIMLIRNRKLKANLSPHALLKTKSTVLDKKVVIGMKDLPNNCNGMLPLGTGIVNTLVTSNLYGQQIMEDSVTSNYGNKVGSLTYSTDYKIRELFRDSGDLTDSADASTLYEYAVPEFEPLTPPQVNQSIYGSFHADTGRRTKSLNSRANGPPSPPRAPPPSVNTWLKTIGKEKKGDLTLYQNFPYEELKEHQYLTPIKEIPREKLHMIELLGDGNFGKVHLCEAQDIPVLIDLPCFNVQSKVVVKSFTDISESTRKTIFQQELILLSQVNDPNIVSLLGMISKSLPPAIILEYPEFGDLNTFLRDHSPFTNSTSGLPSLSYGTLIFLATQVASGMKYLESLNFVHRDLAARNCYVASGYVVKIANFGITTGRFTCEYPSVTNGNRLPLRWMAWESVIMNTFTTKSDVWSFGVTFWEILMSARQRPFQVMSDENVMENIAHMYRDDGQQVYLPQPPFCPKEMYDLMKECWRHVANDRPSFREIHLFLQRKNLGFNKDDIE